ncbi:MAG: serine--tRNA ligase [Spirochaetia bacterium]|nr:serine--tRNA ligase [Spirochaetia bacterium]
MLDLKRIQENPEELEQMLSSRNYQAGDLSGLRELIKKVKLLKADTDKIRQERNSSSKEIGALIGQGKKDEAEKRKSEVKDLGDKIAELETQCEAEETALADIVLGLPNFFEPEVPIGKDESANKLIRESGTKPEFDFKPLTHFEIGENLGILDFERGVKLAGSRFYTYRGLAAKLERALLNFMLDLHTTEFGYTEVWVPILVNDACMTTTGQYPKFKGEYYRLDRDELSLIPTSEVPLVNLYRDEIVEEKDLPIAVTASTSCFRREAGAAGKDTRGLIRVHQFQKVELIQIVHPDKSRETHEQMVKHAEEVLKRLGLPYRIVLLSSGDMGATAAKTYDLEVWMPGMGRYLEISSVSNCLEFQARRGMIRFKEGGAKGKPRLAHTLNGSGVAAGRAMSAIMENYQKKDGTFEIPEVLKSYIK